MNVIIRDAVPADAERIAQFNIALAEETEDRRLDEATVLSGVRNLLDQPQFGLYRVAESASEVIACLMITLEWTDWRDGVFWWIQSVYVDPEHRRKGVFKKLYENIETAARSDPSVRGLRLYVERDNGAAKKTYSELGMTRPGYDMYEVEFS